MTKETTLWLEVTPMVRSAEYLNIATYFAPSFFPATMGEGMGPPLGISAYPSSRPFAELDGCVLFIAGAYQHAFRTAARPKKLGNGREGRANTS